MNGELIGKRDHAQITTAPLRNDGPKSESTILLRLNSNWGLHDTNAHFLREIGRLRKISFSKYAVN